MSSLLALILAGVLAWFWQDSLRARELALAVSRSACKQTGAQLLDQAVSLYGIGIGLSDERKPLIRRRYRFEFSVDGIHRWQGRVVLFGIRLESVQMDHQEGATIIESSGVEL